MDRRDQELLDKQLHHVWFAARPDGVVMPLLLAVFFTGMALGGFFYAYTGEPMHIAATTHVTPNQQIATNEVPIFVPQGRTQQ